MAELTTQRPSIPFISDAEFADRASRLQLAMREHGIDVLLVNSNESDFANVRYLSDYWPVFESAGVLVPCEGPLTLLIGPESGTFASDRSRISRIRMLAAYRESADPEYPGLELDDYTNAFAEVGHVSPKHIAIAGAFATNWVMLAALREAFPDAQFSHADELLTGLRSVKSPAELECLAAAARIAETALGSLLTSIHPGMTELEVVGLAQEAIYAQGAEYEGMVQYVLSGPNSRHAISRPSHRLLKAGDVVQLNISARVAGYAAGIGRPVCMGIATPEQRQVLEFGLEAHFATAEWLKAGIAPREVAERYHDFFCHSGRADLFLYGPCHGLGLMEVEPPWMEVTSDYSFETDMTFQIDTFLCASTFGARWENGVRIAPHGINWFSDRYMEIIEL